MVDNLDIYFFRPYIKMFEIDNFIRVNFSTVFQTLSIHI